MKKGKTFVPLLLLLTSFILLAVLVMQPLTILHFQDYIAFLFPKGEIAIEQRNLLLIIQSIMLFVIIPVYIFTFIFSYIFNANNPQAEYDPDLIDNRIAEYFWWGIPLVLTIVISIFTWVKTEELDPYKPIESEKKAITVQVVALQWKWLFIYPEEKIATVNYLQIPTKTPIHFEITADAPMNSFWIPELGGQIYAMPQMKTELYLIADSKGEFKGYSANFSGEGFAGMNFLTKATSEEEYKHWIASTKQSDKLLNAASYNALIAPSKNNPPEMYQLNDDGLFNKVLDKYMYGKVIQ